MDWTEGERAEHLSKIPAMQRTATQMSIRSALASLNGVDSTGLREVARSFEAASLEMDRAGAQARREGSCERR